MNVSVLTDPGLTYPDSGDGFSPDQRFPEYPWDHLASKPNAVYSAVRSLFRQMKLDHERFDSPDWNPLGDYIRPGDSVFVLCNFVYHRRSRDSVDQMRAKCSHGSVLRALVDYVLIAAGKEATVRFGNAPIQACEWEKVLRDTGADKVAEFYRRSGASVEPRDLRLYVTKRTTLGRVTASELREDPEAAAEIDLGRESMLDELSGAGGSSPRFRVADHDPARTEAFHADGSHRYVIHRAILDSDVVISLPKLKTHKKVGITCGMKGFVGTVGHKDCLAHHRFGNRRSGGDEYPDSQGFLKAASAFHDWVNHRGLRAPLQSLFFVADRNLRRVLHRLGLTGGGSWYGNDTCWRMAVDLARIVHNADSRGVMQTTPQRKQLMLIDGVVAGEGEGPLVPTPLGAGALLFCDDVVAGDRVACRLMGFEPDKVSMLREVTRPMSFSICAPDRGAANIILNGRQVEESAVPAAAGRPFREPPGWVSHLVRSG
jgi:uncharacterized protein (DUF362 family)